MAIDISNPGGDADDLSTALKSALAGSDDPVNFDAGLRSEGPVYTSVIYGTKDPGDGPEIGAGGVGLTIAATRGGGGDATHVPGGGGDIEIISGSGGEATDNGDDGGDGGFINIMPAPGGAGNGGGSTGRHGFIRLFDAAVGDPGLPSYADDTAAATGGVPLGCLYRTASVVKIRVA